MTNPNAGERTVLYRFYAADKTLLYVGITKRLGQRWAEHAKSQPWWPLVDHQTAQWLPVRAEALAAERSAIASEDPMFNIVGAPRKGWVFNADTGFYVDPKPPRRPRCRHPDDLPPMYRGDGSQWPYERTARYITDRISSGELPRGQRLPSQERLAQMAGVSKDTVQNALALLKEQGIVHARPGLGTFIGPPPDAG